MTPTPIQITFRHMPPSPAAESCIQEEAADLDRYFGRIISCHVVVEAPHHHHQRGRGFHVNIVINVPGSNIVINHEPSLHGSPAHGEVAHWQKHLEAHPDHKDLYVCIHDAFNAARRKLEDYARIMRGDIKHHKEAAEAS